MTLRRFLVIAGLILAFSLSAAAQSLTTITGTVRDGNGNLVTSGQVTFNLQPGIDTVTSGVARFAATETDCTITGAGLVKALDGVSVCTLVQNTSIQPSGTSYKACIQPGFIQPGSCFVFYATGASLDITTTPATPSLTPAYSLVDTFSNQTIAGNKTFSGTITFGGSLSLGSVTLGGALTDLFGGTLGGTFAGNLVWSGTQQFNAAISAPSLTSTAANAASSGFLRLARTDQECWRNFANNANVCLSNAGAASSATGGFADNLQYGGAFQATAFVGGGTPAGSGVLNVSNNVCAVAAENSLSNGDICAVKVDGSNNAQIPPPIRQVEQAAPSGIASSDLLWADSTAHRWKMINNNGSAVTVAATSGDTFTTTTLTSPTVNTPTITSPTFNTGVSQGSGFKHQRFGATTATGTTAGAQATTTYTWTSPFADANYTLTVTCSGAGPTVPSISVEGITASNFIVRTAANVVAGSGTTCTNIDAIAVHD